MAISEIEYQLHDSNILAANYNPASGRLELDIRLYEIFYPGSPMVRLNISGIYSKTKVERFYKELTAGPMDEDGLWMRVNRFNYNEKKESCANDLYLFLDVEHVESVRIHCRKIGFVIT